MGHCVSSTKEEHKGMQGTLVTLPPPSPERCPYRGRPVLRNTPNACPVSPGIHSPCRRWSESEFAACGVAAAVKNRVLALFRRLQIVQKHHVRGFAESHAGLTEVAGCGLGRSEENSSHARVSYPSTPAGSLAWELHCCLALCLPCSCHQKSIVHAISIAPSHVVLLRSALLYLSASTISNISRRHTRSKLLMTWLI